MNKENKSIIGLDIIQTEMITGVIFTFLDGLDTLLYLSIEEILQEKYPGTKLKEISFINGWFNFVFTNPDPKCSFLIKEDTVSIEQILGEYNPPRIKYRDEILSDKLSHSNIDKFKKLLI